MRENTMPLKRSDNYTDLETLGNTLAKLEITGNSKNDLKRQTSSMTDVSISSIGSSSLESDSSHIERATKRAKFSSQSNSLGK